MVYAANLLSTATLRRPATGRELMEDSGGGILGLDPIWLEATDVSAGLYEVARQILN